MTSGTKTVVIILSVVGGVIFVGLLGVGALMWWVYTGAGMAALSTTPVPITLKEPMELSRDWTDLKGISGRMRIPIGWTMQEKTMSTGEPGEYAVTTGANVGVVQMDRKFLSYQAYVKANIRDMGKRWTDAVVDDQGPTTVNGLNGYVVLMHRKGNVGEDLRQEFVLLEGSGTTVYVIVMTTFGLHNTHMDALEESVVSTFEQVK